MKLKCTCIIPFFNEKNRINKVLEGISEVRGIDQVICVDDGSEDGGEAGLRKIHPKVEILKLRKNSGKMAAVATALRKVRHGLILLLDADLKGLTSVPIGKLVSHMKNGRAVDMLIIAGKHVFPNTYFSRSNIVFSGQRLLYREDLVDALALKNGRYQLEIAINDVAIRKKRRVAVFESGLTHPPKVEKYGSKAGIVREVQMLANVMSYGLMKYYGQIIFFAREKFRLEQYED